MAITELPPFNPRLDDYRAEEFLAHSLALLEYPIQQDQTALDFAPFQVQPPLPPPEPPLPLLPHIWYPKPTLGVSHLAPQTVKSPRPIQFMGHAARDAAERAMRPLLAGHGTMQIQGEAGIGKTTLLQYIATHERTRQRFRRVWYFDDAQRVGQLCAILLDDANILAQTDIYAQFSLLGNALDDNTLLVIDNLYPDHPLLTACQSLSPFVLMGVEVPYIPLEEDEEEYPEDPPNVVTLRRLADRDAINMLADIAKLKGERGISRETQPLLEQTAHLLDYHPLGLSIAAHMLNEDDLRVPQWLGLLQQTAEAHQLPRGYDIAIHLCIESLPAEYRGLLESFGAFSPNGVPLDGLMSVGGFKHELTLQRGLALLRRRHLIQADRRYDDVYVASSPVYRQMQATEPYTPGKKLGERTRKWLADYINEAAYDPAAVFAVETQLRFVYELVERYKLGDLVAKLNPRVSDYLRTYIPALVPPNAPPPRATGERAKAIQLARHGLTLLEEGDPDQGREVLESALESLDVHGSEHEQAEALVMLAQLETTQGDHDTAINHLEAAAKLVFDLDAEASMSLARLGLAMAYRRAGRHKDALGVLDDRPEAQAERARTFRAMGNMDAMLEALSTQSDMPPYARAESFLQAQRYADALEAISDDNSPESHHLRALIYHLQGDYSQAIRGYELAMSIYAEDDPQRANSVRAMAGIHTLQENFEAAETLLNQTADTLAASPTQQGQVISLLAAVHLCQNNNRTAIELVTQAIEKLNGSGLHSDLADAYRTLGRAAWRLERYNEAREAFIQETEHAQSLLIRDETRIGIGFFHVAEAYRITEEPDRAIANHRRALSHLKPDEEPQIHFIVQSGLYRVLRERERFADALEVNHAAIALLDKHPPQNLQHLGYMLGRNTRDYHQEGDMNRAYQAFSRWLNTLAGRADALSREKPLLAILALSLATRSLVALGRPKEALPLAAEALSLADLHATEDAWKPAAWAARRDHGEVLLSEAQWDDARRTLTSLLNDQVKEHVYIYAAAQDGMGFAVHNLGEHQTALEHFWIALDHQPNTHQQGLIFERVALSYLALGDTSNAIENFNEAIKFLDRKGFPGDMARVLTLLAHTLAGVNRYGDAIGVYEEALNMLQAIPDASPLYTAQVYSSLGRSNEIQGQLHQAAEAFRNALKTLEDNRVNAPHEHRGITLELARVLVLLEDYYAAIPYFEKARDAATDWGTQKEIGNITRELAEAERDGGDVPKSLSTFADGLEILTADDFPKDRAALLRSYGKALSQVEQFEEARAAWNEALVITFDADPQEIALTHHAIGQAYRAQQAYNDAVKAFKQAVDTHKRGTVERAASLREWGESLVEAERYSEAVKPLETSLEIEKALPQQSNARLVKLTQLLGYIGEQREERQAAIAHYHVSLVYMDRAFQPMLYAETLRTLGKLYAAEENWDDCQKSLNEALDIEMAIKPRNEERIAFTLRMMGDAYHNAGHLEHAATAYKRMATYANLTKDEATKLRATLDDIERHKATLKAAHESLQVLERTGADSKDFAYVYALMVRMHFLLSEMELSRTTMDTLVKFMNAHVDEFSPDDDRSAYRSLANYRQAMEFELQGDRSRARDHYRLALKDNTDSAMGWLIEQSMGGVS